MMEKKLMYLETAFIAILFVSILLQNFDVSVIVPISIALGGLALVFFLNAYVPKSPSPNQDDKTLGFKDLLVQSILPKVLWISMAVSVCGLLFYVLKFKGSMNMMFMGGSTILIAALTILVFKFSGTRNTAMAIAILYRAIPILLTIIYIRFY